MSPQRSPPVLVLGAGIIGLTTAIRLYEAGHAVTIVAQETPETILSRDNSALLGTSPGSYVSSGAGGLWMPHILEGDDVRDWSTTAFNVFEKELSQNVGVWDRDAYLVRKTATNRDMPWFGELTGMKVVTPEEDGRVPPEYGCALKFRTLIVDMTVYLRHLQDRLKGLGIEIELTGEIDGDKENGKWDEERVLEFARERWGTEVVVVNCFGIWAGMVSGEEMTPVRGVIVRVKARQGWDYMITEDVQDAHICTGGLLAYGIPRGDKEFLMGGTALKGDWREKATATEVEGVKERSSALMRPSEKVEEVSVWAGLRPLRMDGKARVEVQQDGIGKKLAMIANYGHGGSGVTVCWGCAESVVKLVAEFTATELLN